MATVRVRDSTHEKLARLSRDTGRSMAELIDDSVERLEQEHLLDRANRAFATLRADDDGWHEELEERRAWEGTLADDVEPEQA
jgi:predicted DNA-binding protein